MKSFCIYTPLYKQSNLGLKKCIDSGRKFGIKVNEFQSIVPNNLKYTVEKHGLTFRYTPVNQKIKTNFNKKLAPAFRICNGMSHYLLYLNCVEDGVPYMILEHDSFFVDIPITEKIPNGVIQISSHKPFQINAEQMKTCMRANKMFIHQPDYKYDDTWDQHTGIIKHPLSGTNGTSGYIITPGAAQCMIDYIKDTGIGFADRIRSDHLGSNNLWIQYPFPVFNTNM